MDCFDDYGTSGAPPVRSNYIRKDEALDDLWENSVATGINFAKYEDIKVVHREFPRGRLLSPAEEQHPARQVQLPHSGAEVRHPHHPAAEGHHGLCSDW